MRYYLQYLRTYLIIKRKQLLNKITRAKGYDYTAFVILCEPRSGSTLLHTYLNSHTQVLSYGEVLRMVLEKGKKSNNVVSDKVFKPYGRQIKAVGLKLFYEYVDHPDYRDSFSQIVQRKDVKVIHLVRKNLLELYVSLKTAEQTNVWSTTKPSKQTVPIQVDVDDCQKFVALHQQHQTLFTDLFKNHAVLEVAYEELAEYPQQTLLTVQTFLGVEPQNLFTLLTKQSHGSVSTRISNYAEVEARLNPIHVN
jgi:LPS sulfotransferase NodH